MKRLAATTAVLAALAAPALAGGLDVPLAEPIIAPAAPLAFGPSFAGAYAGGSLGAGSLDVGDMFDIFNGDDDDGDTNDLDDTDTDFHYGLHAGFNVQSGNVVYGGELAVFGNEGEVGGDLFDGDDEAEDEGSVGVDLSYGARLVARGGYAFGSNLVYGVAGVAYAEVDVTTEIGGIMDDDSDVGYAVGFGYERLIGERIVVGAQYTLHAFDDFGDDDDEIAGETDLDYRTLEARVSFKF